MTYQLGLRTHKLIKIDLLVKGNRNFSTLDFLKWLAFLSVTIKLISI
jgi:hypothetical protein